MLTTTERQKIAEALVSGGLFEAIEDILLPSLVAWCPAGQHLVRPVSDGHVLLCQRCEGLVEEPDKADLRRRIVITVNDEGAVDIEALTPTGGLLGAATYLATEDWREAIDEMVKRHLR